MTEREQRLKAQEDEALQNYYERLIEADNRDSEPYYIGTEPKPGLAQSWYDLFRFGLRMILALCFVVAVLSTFVLLSKGGLDWLKGVRR
jgi:hypothetical protein